MMNHVIGFIREDCKIGTEHSIQKSLIYEAYRIYMTRHGEVPVSQNIFCRWMNKRFGDKRLNCFRIFEGITLNDPPIGVIIDPKEQQRLYSRQRYEKNPEYEAELPPLENLVPIPPIQMENPPDPVAIPKQISVLLPSVPTEVLPELQQTPSPKELPKEPPNPPKLLVIPPINRFPTPVYYQTVRPIPANIESLCDRYRETIQWIIDNKSIMDLRTMGDFSNIMNNFPPKVNLRELDIKEHQTIMAWCDHDITICKRFVETLGTDGSARTTIRMRSKKIERFQELFKKSFDLIDVMETQ